MHYNNIEIARLLSDFRAEWHGRRLNYGIFDCAQMAAAWLWASCEIDALADIPQYKSRTGAMKIIKNMGFKTFSDAITSKLEPLENHNFCQIGDFLTMESGIKNMNALAILVDANLVLAFGEVTDDAGQIIKNSSQVRLLTRDFATGEAWRLPCRK